jgi:recombinational DNA repair protein RecT
VESNVAICVYSYNHVNARYTCRQKLNYKETVATTTTVTITKRPALTIAAPAAVMTAAAIAAALLGLPIPFCAYNSYMSY